MITCERLSGKSKRWIQLRTPRGTPGRWPSTDRCFIRKATFVDQAS